MRLADVRYEEIKERVVEVYNECGFITIPVSALAIADKFNILLFPYSSLSKKKQKMCLNTSKDGFSLIHLGKYSIFYNDNNLEERIRFTIFHEFGHYFLGHKCPSEMAEAEGSFFARYALAPIILIDYFELESPDEVSKKFQISYEAAVNAYNHFKKRVNYGPKTMI